jgi:hypothetical protein
MEMIKWVGSISISARVSVIEAAGVRGRLSMRGAAVRGLLAAAPGGVAWCSSASNAAVLAGCLPGWLAWASSFPPQRLRFRFALPHCLFKCPAPQAPTC